MHTPTLHLTVTGRQIQTFNKPPLLAANKISWCQSLASTNTRRTITPCCYEIYTVLGENFVFLCTACRKICKIACVFSVVMLQWNIRRYITAADKREWPRGWSGIPDWCVIE